MLALDEHRELDGLADSDVLALASQELRVVVTFNVRDFAPILREWAERQRPHAGCLLLVGIAQNEFPLILKRIGTALDERPEQKDWIDRALFLGRRG